MKSLLILNKHISNIKYFSRQISQNLSKGNIIINPIKCLQDEPVNIQIKNLSPDMDVTLTSSAKDTKGNIFLTNTHYRSDQNGAINLSKDASIGGTYKGIFPMGPIANLQADPKSYKYTRFVNRDPAHPLVMKFNLLKGHLDADKVLDVDPDLILDSVDHERVYMAPNCKRIPVRKGRIRGTLFLPEGDGPFPGLIDMFGTAGGLIEFRAAQFATRGIASLALAFFDYDDLPKYMTEIDLSYFEEAVDFLISQDKVRKSGVAALGSSKGGDIVCSMGTFIPEVKAVICINGIPVNTWCPLHLKDRTIPGLIFNVERGKFVESDLILTTDMLDNSEEFPETHLPLHESDAKFLFIVGKEDKNWKSDLETDRGVARMKAHGNTNFEVLKYEGAGHLLESPFSPFAYATHHKMANAALIWGGNAIQHTQAQVDSWSKIIKFIKSTIV